MGWGNIQGYLITELYKAAPPHHRCDVERSHYINKNKFKGGAYIRDGALIEMRALTQFITVE